MNSKPQAPKGRKKRTESALSNVLPFPAHPAAAAAPPLSLPSDTTEVDLNEFLIRDPENCFGINVTGDGDEEHGVVPGDFLILNRALPPRPGDLVMTDGADRYQLARISGLSDRRKLGSCAVVTVIIRQLRAGENIRAKGGAR
jgi:hypothetical protein